MVLGNSWKGLVLGLCLLIPSGAGAEVLTVTPPTGDIHAGTSIDVTIAIDDSLAVAGSAFTLVYDTDVFLLTGISSTVFNTFTSQWQSLDSPPDPPPPADVTVSGQLYTQPLIGNTAADGTMIAAARVNSGVNASTLFTLTFTIDNDAPLGSYPITIQPTILNNSAAGYPADGMAVPVLVGAIAGQTDPTLAYPVIPVSLVSGNIVLIILDNDTDGIDDNWEIKYFGSINDANATSDSDHDGYSDKQEYLNQTNEIVDSNGDIFNPNAKNAPNGVGYVGKNFMPAIYMLMLKKDIQ